MNPDLKNILDQSNKDIDNQQLMQYLQQQLSKDALHDFEAQLNDDEFMNDAVEGLQALPEQKIPVYLEQLQQNLKQQVQQQNKRKKKRWKDNPQSYLIILLVLLLILLAYFVTSKFLAVAHP